ncbi:MAG: hypothetical protein HPY75_01190 [Actinobacteria bacterium]|nr:hypothetical protein [Actinomycetota bacterium]
MQLYYKRSLKLALAEKRLWPAGLLAALALSEAWWVVFGWGPEFLGERWRSALAGRLGDAWALVAFAAAAVAAFAVTKALGYMAEMVLVRQVADGEEGPVPDFTAAFSASRGRYLSLAAALLPWDILRTGLIYLPAAGIALWERWDPHLDHVFLYIFATLLWFALLAAAAFLFGVTATLAGRLALLHGQGARAAWGGGWKLLQSQTAGCIAVWLQALAADIAFVVLAWPLSALVPWAVGLAVRSIGPAPLRGLMYLGAYGLFAAALIAGQALVQCYKSSLWTFTYIELARGENHRIS